jgi:hypothetical protein
MRDLVAWAQGKSFFFAIWIYVINCDRSIFKLVGHFVPLLQCTFAELYCRLLLQAWHNKPLLISLLTPLAGRLPHSWSASLQADYLISKGLRKSVCSALLFTMHLHRYVLSELLNCKHKELWKIRFFHYTVRLKTVSTINLDREKELHWKA